MKIKFPTLLVALFLLTPAITNAQLGKFINKTAKSINNAVDSTLAKRSKAKHAEASGQQTDTPSAIEKTTPREVNVDALGGKVKLKYEEQYDFGSKMHPITEVFENKQSM